MKISSVDIIKLRGIHALEQAEINTIMIYTRETRKQSLKNVFVRCVEYESSINTIAHREIRGA